MVIELASQLPPGAIWEMLPFDEGCHYGLFPSEQVTIGSAVENSRQAATAHEPRSPAWGLGSIEIPSGPDRAPVWPPGVVGSISHCENLAVAAVAARGAVLGLGVDCEVRLRVSRDLSPTTDERDGAGLPVDPAGEWLTAVFSAKEAVYKAVYPTMRRVIGFHAVRIRFAADGTTFRAEVSGNEGTRLAREPQGAVHFDSRHVLTAAWLPSQKARDIG